MRYNGKREDKRGDVGVEGALNDILDVYRVEQRLKYLGYPVYKDNGDSVKSFIAGDKSYRVPNEFKVDGIFTSKEESASGAYAERRQKETMHLNALPRELPRLALSGGRQI